MRTQFVRRLVASPTVHAAWRTDRSVRILLKCWKWRTQWCAKRGRWTIWIDVASFAWRFTFTPFRSTILRKRKPLNWPSFETFTQKSYKILGWEFFFLLSLYSLLITIVHLPETTLGHGIHLDAIWVQVLRAQIHLDMVHVQRLVQVPPIEMQWMLFWMMDEKKEMFKWKNEKKNRKNNVNLLFFSTVFASRLNKVINNHKILFMAKLLFGFHRTKHTDRDLNQCAIDIRLEVVALKPFIRWAQMPWGEKKHILVDLSELNRNNLLANVHWIVKYTFFFFFFLLSFRVSFNVLSRMQGEGKGQKRSNRFES